MYEVLVTKVNQDKLHEYLAWGRELMGVRRIEAQESLKKEGMLRESAFFVNINSEPYIVHITEGNDVPLPADMSMEINKTHREKNRAVLLRDKRYEGKLVYDVRQ